MSATAAGLTIQAVEGKAGQAAAGSLAEKPVAHQVAAFFYVESCGLCPSCKFGGGEVTAYLANRVVLEALGGVAWRRRRDRGEAVRNPAEPLLARQAAPLPTSCLAELVLPPARVPRVQV